MGFLASLALALLECFRRRHSEELSSTNPAKPSEPKTSEESKTPIPKKPSTFKLLNLPWVAFNEVVKSMDPRDVFLMSLCSENTFTILKTWRTKVKWLCYIVDGNDLFVDISQSYNKNDSLYLAGTFSEIYEDVENQQQLVGVRIGGMDVQCL
ncbi:hypothetical protein CAEBREN_11674 [Caenorhabditis brenneri]|uniref:F-box domain-containing protein n=1 Tax=Caenorhabditis brenneri TaxID=135651 RepID=G0NCI7_CAEBE|nr:hypothetical protein CAEBREN_11674 [Caenorhabditis brenneri]